MDVLAAFFLIMVAIPAVIMLWMLVYVLYQEIRDDF